jgi:hypothetical protein
MIAFIPLMLLLIGASVAGQEFLPPLVLDSDDGTMQVFFLLPWVTFYALSLAVPYPLMLIFALVTGFLWDARAAVVLDPVEFRLGTTVAFFALFGSFTQGVRPLFRKGNWFFPTLMVGTAVFFHLLGEFVLVCFVRGSVEISRDVWCKVLLSTLVASIMAPFLLYFISQTAKKCGYQLHQGQFTFRRHTHGYPI